MPRVEQFEVWVYQQNRWELVAAFFDHDVAAEVASNRGSRVRLVHAIYEEGKPPQQETLAEIGATRNEP